MGNHTSELIVRRDTVGEIDVYDEYENTQFDTTDAIKTYLLGNISRRSCLCSITIHNPKLYWQEIKDNLLHCGMLKELLLSNCDLTMAMELAQLLPDKKIKMIDICFAPGDEIDVSNVRAVLSLFPYFGAETFHTHKNSREVCRQISMHENLREAQLGNRN
jgi:hypothetical protein